MYKNFKQQKILLFFIFLIAILYICIWNQSLFHSYYYETPDGNLYLSIADNFIKNGHFIQYARPYEIKMVVPPGLPFILSLILLCFRNLESILVIQYIVFGLTAVLISATCYNLYKNIYLEILSGFIYCLHPFITKFANPGACLTEIWYMFFSLLCIFILSTDMLERRRLDFITINICIIILIRPVFSVWLLPIIVIILFNLFKKKILGSTIIILSVFVAVLIGNMFINYREVGEPVLFENYAGIALYQANNTNTKTYAYGSDVADEFVEDRFWNIYESKLSSSEKSKYFNEWAVDYIKKNKIEVLKNTVVKWKIMFIDYYKPAFYLYLISFILLLLIDKEKSFYLLLTYSFFSISISTSFGVNMPRYSIIVIPIYIIFILGFFKIFRFAYDKYKRWGNHKSVKA